MHWLGLVIYNDGLLWGGWGGLGPDIFFWYDQSTTINRLWNLFFLANSAPRFQKPWFFLRKIPRETPSFHLRELRDQAEVQEAEDNWSLEFPPFRFLFKNTSQHQELLVVSDFFWYISLQITRKRSQLWHLKLHHQGETATVPTIATSPVSILRIQHLGVREIYAQGRRRGVAVSLMELYSCFPHLSKFDAFNQVSYVFSITLPKTNIAPENRPS